MINKEEHPVGWALLLQELDDAHEHLAKLIEQLAHDETYDEADFRVDLGHVYAHLNRAWRRRLVSEDFNSEDWEASRAYPDDLQPIA